MSGVNICRMGSGVRLYGVFVTARGANTDWSITQTDLSYWTATSALCVFTATVSLDKAITGKRVEIPKVAGNNNLETAEEMSEL